MNPQTLITMEHALKECYLPAWKNQLSTEPTPLLGKTKRVKVTSDKIVATAPIGLSGGFGFGGEGDKTPAAGNLNYSKFETRTKDAYVNICISEKAIELADTTGAMVNAFEREIEAGYETAKWNCGRSIYGNGTGKLATVSAQSSGASATVTIDSCKNVKEGLIIDIYTTAGVLVCTRRIVAVSRAADTSGKYTITLNKAPDSALDAGFITVQNSYNREYTGLGAIYDDNIATLYGLSKSANPWLKPIVTSAAEGISDGLITGILRRAQNEKNSKIDTILCGDAAYDAYAEYLRSTNNRNELATHDMVGGFQAITFKHGNRIVDVVNESFIPDGEMWGVDSTALELHETGWDFATQKDSSIFTLLNDASVYRALLRNYGDLICTNPGGCIKITDVA